MEIQGWFYCILLTFVLLFKNIRLTYSSILQSISEIFKPANDYPQKYLFRSYKIFIFTTFLHFCNCLYFAMSLSFVIGWIRFQFYHYNTYHMKAHYYFTSSRYLFHISIYYTLSAQLTFTKEPFTKTATLRSHLQSNIIYLFRIGRDIQSQWTFF